MCLHATPAITPNQSYVYIYIYIHSRIFTVYIFSMLTTGRTCIIHRSFKVNTNTAISQNTYTITYRAPPPGVSNYSVLEVKGYPLTTSNQGALVHNAVNSSLTGVVSPPPLTAATWPDLQGHPGSLRLHRAGRATRGLAVCFAGFAGHVLLLDSDLSSEAKHNLLSWQCTP